MFFLQDNWEKRVVKSLNSMSTELEVPLSRKVAKIWSVTDILAKPKQIVSSQMTVLHSLVKKC